MISNNLDIFILLYVIWFPFIDVILCPYWVFVSCFICLFFFCSDYQFYTHRLIVNVFSVSAWKIHYFINIYFRHEKHKAIAQIKRIKYTGKLKRNGYRIKTKLNKKYACGVSFKMFTVVISQTWVLNISIFFWFSSQIIILS